MKQYTLTNGQGLRVTLLDYGATIATVETPDRHDKLADITLGFDDFAGWLKNGPYFGATVGRFANRIAGGKFTLDGKAYTLATNNTPGGLPCHLHGGKEGFDRKLWSARLLEKPGAHGVEFSYVSPDGEEGYPGRLEARVTYWLTELNELVLEFVATTDRPTIVNLTNHNYWNLTGDMTRPVLDHQLVVAADAILPVNAGLIPTGAPAPVAGTPFDFTQGKAIGRDIGADHEQLKMGNGYDHCWILRDGPGVRPAARVYEPTSGRMLELFTDQPGLQFYSGNYLDGTMKGKGGTAYRARTGLALEPQRFPDAPNQPQFPSAVLRPGEVYRHTMKYRFSVQ